MAEQENNENPTAGPLTQPGTPPSPSTPALPSSQNSDEGTAQPTIVEETEEYTGPAPLEGEPNVRLAKSAADKALAQGVTNIGMKTYILPNKQGQLNGFHVEDPSGLVNQFLGIYKYVKPKGPVTPTESKENIDDTTQS